MNLGWKARKWLEKKSKGFRGYPAGTVAFYGPDNSRATKAAVAIVEQEDEEPSHLTRWFIEHGDLRKDEAILAEVAQFLREHDVRSVGMVQDIFGCPHEEGIDYPSGELCPQCPFWAGRDRVADMKSSIFRGR